MNDYSDIIFLMGAMIIFSMLTLNTATFFRTAEQLQYQNTIQYNGVAIAQDKIEQLRWIADEQRFQSGSIDFIENDYPATETQVFGSNGEYNMDYNVDVDIELTSVSGSNARNYLITVIVSNEYLEENQNVTMQYIKSFGE